MSSSLTDKSVNTSQKAKMPEENQSQHHERQQPPEESNIRQPILYPPLQSKKGLADAYILCIGLGFLGAHHFYLRRPIFGLVYFFTCGLCLFGWVIDWFRIPHLVEITNQKNNSDPRQPELKDLSDAYVLWMPLGFLGLHHLYLRRWGWGTLYFFTFGLLTIGWIVDGFRMKSLVQSANESILQQHPRHKDLTTAYVLTLIPLTGLFGAHHYYLGRIGMGLSYTITCGHFGLGWLIDVFRMPCLVNHVNQQIEYGYDGKKRLDDAYVYLVPLGIFGAHHLYLKRYVWFILYFCTCGMFGIGFLIDFCRLPFLVKEYNEDIERQRGQVIQNPVIQGVVNPVMVVPQVTGQGGHPGPVYPGYPGPYQPGCIAAQGGFPGPMGQYPYGNAYPPQMQPYLPDYNGATGHASHPQTGPNSLVSIASSNVDDPPSYIDAMNESEQNSINEAKPSAPYDNNI